MGRGVTLELSDEETTILANLIGGEIRGLRTLEQSHSLTGGGRVRLDYLVAIANEINTERARKGPSKVDEEFGRR